jgi:hypothetical protein
MARGQRYFRKRLIIEKDIIMALEIKEVRIIEKYEAGILEVHVTGKLEKEDYERFVPEIEKFMHDFHGWTAGALWEDIKFDLKHFNDIERLAIVGETKWQHGMTIFCKPFTTAKIQYFEEDDMETALSWIAED